MSKSATENLFAYGTLQHEDVQLASFGRRLEGSQDALAGYRMATTQVRDENFVRTNGARQRTLEFTGNASDVVTGMVFQVTDRELAQADQYEPTDYARAQVELKSGITAWVYLQTPE